MGKHSRRRESARLLRVLQLRDLQHELQRGRRSSLDELVGTGLRFSLVAGRDEDRLLLRPGRGLRGLHDGSRRLQCDAAYRELDQRCAARLVSGREQDRVHLRQGRQRGGLHDERRWDEPGARHQWRRSRDRPRVVPDGSKIAFERLPAGGGTPEVFTSNPDGSAEVEVVSSTDGAGGSAPDWQPTYEIPNNASSISVALVPSFRQTISATQCSARGGTPTTHASPFSVGACSPAGSPGRDSGAAWNTGGRQRHAHRGAGTPPRGPTRPTRRSPSLSRM